MPKVSALLLRALLACLMTCALVARAAPSVSSAVCDTSGTTGWSLCSTGTVVTFTGSGLSSVSEVLIGRTAHQQQTVFVCGSLHAVSDAKLQCTLALAASGDAFDGEYPVTLAESATSATTVVGNILIGNFYGQPNITTWTTHALTPAAYMTYAAATAAIELESGATWAINGHFDPQQEYAVWLYNTEAGMVAEGEGALTPRCTVTSVARGSLSCVLTSFRNGMGMYAAQVAAVAPGSSAPFSPLVQQVGARRTISVRPPPATVSAAAGDCCVSSASCTTGASITFTGANFNSRSATGAYVFLTVGGRGGSTGLTLRPTAVNAEGTSVTATLEAAVAASDAVAGEYPVYWEQQSCTHGMRSAPVLAGRLLIGDFRQAQLPGWSAAATALSPSRVVSGRSPSWLSAGETLTVAGSFDPAQTYSILFYNTESASKSPMADDNTVDRPSCQSVGVSATALTCVVTTTANSVGMYGFLVREGGSSGAILPGSTALASLAVNPPPLAITAAACTSTSCAGPGPVTLRLTGSGFNTMGVNYTSLALVGVDGASVVTSAVSAAALEATVTLPSSVPSGTYAVQARVRVCAMDMESPPQTVAVLQVGPTLRFALAPVAVVSAVSADADPAAPGTALLSVHGSGFQAGGAALTATLITTEATAVTIFSGALTVHSASYATATVSTAALAAPATAAVAVLQEGLPVPAASALRVHLRPTARAYAASGDCVMGGGDNCAPGARLTFTRRSSSGSGGASGVVVPETRVVVSVGTAAADTTSALCPVESATLDRVTCVLAAAPASAAPGDVVRFAVLQDPGSSGNATAAAGAVPVPPASLRLTGSGAWTARSTAMMDDDQPFGIEKLIGVAGYRAAVALACIAAVACVAVTVGLIIMCCQRCRRIKRQAAYREETLSQVVH